MHEQQKAGAKEDTDSRSGDEPYQGEVKTGCRPEAPPTLWGRGAAPGLAAMTGRSTLRIWYLRGDRGVEADFASQARALHCPVAVDASSHVSANISFRPIDWLLLYSGKPVAG